MARLGCILLALALAGVLYAVAAAWLIADVLRVVRRVERPSQAGPMGSGRPGNAPSLSRCGKRRPA